jgi:ATP-dependent Clp protease protease subunit
MSRSETCEAKACGIIDEGFDERPQPVDDSGTGAGDVTPA